MDILIFILQMRKCKLKKEKELTQSCITFKQQSEIKIWVIITNQSGMLKEMGRREAMDRWQRYERERVIPPFLRLG